MAVKTRDSERRHFKFVTKLDLGKLEQKYAKFSPKGAWPRSRDL